MAARPAKRKIAAPPLEDLTRWWAEQEAAFRDPADVVGSGGGLDPRLIEQRASGSWWDIVEEMGGALLLTREYEHLVLALVRHKGRTRVSAMRLPHPSGLAVDPATETLSIACTRNPNQLRTFRPMDGALPRLDVKAAPPEGRPLLPHETLYLPGSTYLHDLALVGGVLYGNSVGQNAVVRLTGGEAERVWWPRCIETPDGPIFGQNHIQLNSIAAGNSLEESFFSASTEHIGRLRPGHKNFPVDGRGVIFSGRTREPVVRGLTRPHSARLHQGRLWVANSGYGELTLVEGGQRTTVSRLPGWTRGLAFWKQIAIVATSRVIPRFRQYAPGLDVERSVCGLHAVDVQSGALLGSLTWPYGYQIFGIEIAPPGMTTGFPFQAGRKTNTSSTRTLFYTFKLAGH